MTASSAFDVPPIILDETASDIQLLGSFPAFLKVPEIPALDAILATASAGSFQAGLASEAVSSMPAGLPKTAWKTLEPVLMFGKIALGEESKEKKESITGTLTLEEHPMKHRRAFRRWFIETATRGKVPLVSNFSLLQAVKNSGLFDVSVRAEGKWIKTQNARGTGFFELERLSPVESTGPIASGSAASGSKFIHPAPENVASESISVASAPVPLAASPSSMISSDSSPMEAPKPVAASEGPAVSGEFEEPELSRPVDFDEPEDSQPSIQPIQSEPASFSQLLSASQAREILNMPPASETASSPMAR